jgi:hypothetical protein
VPAHSWLQSLLFNVQQKSGLSPTDAFNKFSISPGEAKMQGLNGLRDFVNGSDGSEQALHCLPIRESHRAY